MNDNFVRLLQGYKKFREKYVFGDQAVMQSLSYHGQQPQVMVVACCDSRVDPALILQCDPGDLFVVRNVANIVPPYEKDEAHHGTSAALEFGIRFLGVNHLILLGHSQCGGVKAFLNGHAGALGSEDDFITNWVSLIRSKEDLSFHQDMHSDDYAKQALRLSAQNCLTFPWIRDAVNQKKLVIHLWFFDIRTGQIFTSATEGASYQPLEQAFSSMP